MIETYLFSDNKVTEDVPLANWRKLADGDGKLLWVDVRGATREDVDLLERQFGLHSVAVRSVFNGYHRPHLYEFSDHFYVNFTVINPDNISGNGLSVSELHMFAGNNWLITMSRDKNAAVDEALNEFIENPGLSTRGPIYAVYLLAEDLVETYFPLVENLDDQADRLESEMLDRADKESLREVFDLKHRAFEIRKVLGPQRDIMNELARRDFPFMEGENRVYFQDVYGRMIRIFDMLDTVREILSGNLDIYLSTVSNRLNEIMKVLTVFAAILGTLTLVTGFFGMNILLPAWAATPTALPLLLAVMVLTSAVLYIVAKRIKWL